MCYGSGILTRDWKDWSRPPFPADTENGGSRKWREARSGEILALILEMAGTYCGVMFIHGISPLSRQSSIAVGKYRWYICYPRGSFPPQWEGLGSSAKRKRPRSDPTCTSSNTPSVKSPAASADDASAGRGDTHTVLTQGAGLGLARLGRARNEAGNDTAQRERHAVRRRARMNAHHDRMPEGQP